METKKEMLSLFFRNLLIYTAIFAGSYVLYSIHASDPQAIPHTDFSFVYAQF